MSTRERTSTRKPKENTVIKNKTEPIPCDICEGSGFAGYDDELDRPLCEVCNGTGHEPVQTAEPEEEQIKPGIRAQTLLKWHSVASALFLLGIVGTTLVHLSKLTIISERTREVFGGSDRTDKINALTQLVTTNTNYQGIVGLFIILLAVNAWRFAVIHKEEREGIRL